MCHIWGYVYLVLNECAELLNVNLYVTVTDLWCVHSSVKVCSEEMCLHSNRQNLQIVYTVTHFIIITCGLKANRKYNEARCQCAHVTLTVSVIQESSITTALQWRPGDLPEIDGVHVR
jgi:hypothetical protein